MTHELKLDLGFDNVVLNWPQGARELGILEYCNIMEEIIVKNCKLECKRYLQHFVEFRNQQIDTIDNSQKQFYQETTDFIAKYIDEIDQNPEPGGSNELWWYYIDNDKNLLEVFNLDILFCSAHFIYHLNRYYQYPHDHSNVTVTDLYTSICNGFISRHNYMDYSTILKAWLMLFRIVAKREQNDLLTRTESRDLFEELFEKMINDIGELTYTSTYYHYLVHYWKEVFDMVLDYLVLNDDKLLNERSKILSKSLQYIVLIRNATHKYKEVVQFVYNDCGYGDFNMKLILQDTATAVNQPIIEDFDMDRYEDFDMDRYWWGMDVGWSMGDMNHEEIKLYDEFLNNKNTDDFMQFVHDLKGNIKFAESIERRKCEINLLNNLKKVHNFDGFLHFTDFRNLELIVKHGKLLSRNASSDFLQVDAAEQSVINRTDETIKRHVRFYYKEKTPTLYSNEGIRQNNMQPHMPIPTMLSFDERLIYRLDKLFLDGGGGSAYTRSTKNAKEAMNFRWDQIFYRGAIPNGNNTLLSVLGETDGHVLTNRKNAEFLCLDEVSLDYLEKITFRSPSDLKMFEMLEIQTDNVKLVVDSTKFIVKENCEFLYDYQINVDRDGIYLGYIFFRYSDKFRYSLLLFNGIEEEVVFDLKNDESRDGVYRLEIPVTLTNYDFYCRIEYNLLQKIDRIELYIDDVCCMTWRKSNDKLFEKYCI